jgi:rhodanese-related sulfurtransferase
MIHWAGRLLAAAAWLVAVSCGGPQVVSSKPPSSPVENGKQEAPAVKPGVVSTMPMDRYFPLQQSGSALTIDVRPSFYFSLGHIPGAVSWPKSSYQSQLAVHEVTLQAAIKAGRPIVLYCTDRACPDSGTVAQRLAARGYSVAILEGGYADWKAAEMPTE